MPTREDIARRGVRPEDVDDVVEIAAELQARRDTKAREVAPEDIRKVAAEVDVDPGLVDDAIAELHRRRAADEQDRAASRARAKTVRTGVAVVALALSLLGTGMTVAAGNDIAEARDGEAAAEQALVTQLERQATLAPQALALAGAGADVSAQIAAVRDAPDLKARVEASRALSDSLSAALAKLPPPASDRDAEMRLNLSYELTGTQNRIATETTRWQAAHQRTLAARQGLFAHVAEAVGLD